MPSNKRHLFSSQDPGFTQSQGPNCPVCNTVNADFGSYGPFVPNEPRRLLHGWCPACTNVRIQSDAVNEVRNQRKAHLLSAYLRRLPEEAWKSEREIVTVDNLEQCTSSISELPIVDQFDLCLKTICEMCPLVGAESKFNYETDWPLLIAESAETALFIVSELANAGYLKTHVPFGPFPPKPTWKAYERLQLIQSSGRNSEIGFVAMSFAADQLPVWLQVIKPGVEDAGYRPVRVDQNEHNRRIDDEIIAGIKRCRFLVADFTGQKNGVYFEAGMALGLGRNVVWMCNHANKEALHFDTRQFNHILYDDFVHAKSALTNRIVALEGPGNYVPSKSTSS